MRASRVWLWILSLWVTVLVTPGAAHAGPVQVATDVSARKVELGERFTLTLTLSSDEPLGRVTRPAFTAPVGITVEGPSVATTSQTRIVNGVRTSQSSARLTFTLTPHALGTIVLPAPSATVDGREVRGQTITVQVVPASGGSSLGAGIPGVPMQLFPPGMDFDDAGADDDSASAKELSMATGPDDVVFLRAIADKERVLVGEQVTVSVYLYYRVDYEMTERHDAKFKDFLRFPLLLDPGSTAPVFPRVNGKRYGARLVDRVALIPLRAGKLSTGSMSARFNGRKIGARVMKTANELVIDAAEPPADGRPAGYTVGDVGQFTMTGVVTPRRTRQGGSIGVVLTVDGVGNVPSKLLVPERKGVEWLDPRTRDAISSKGGKVGGRRTFEYVVRLKTAGTVDLGAAELPYYDPVAGRYQVARVDLGKVEVDEAPPTDREVDRAQKADPADDPLANLPPPRSELPPFERQQSQSISTALLAGALAVPPGLALLWMALARALASVRNRKGAPQSELRAKAREALSDAKKAEKGGAPRDVFAAVERAVGLWLEARSGVRARGLRLGELVPRLIEVGVPREVADEAHSILEECEGKRFAPDTDESATRELVKRAGALGKRLSA